MSGTAVAAIFLLVALVIVVINDWTKARAHDRAMMRGEFARAGK